MFNIVVGDLLLAKEKYLCHQCNCITKYAKYLAKSIFNQYPYADIYAVRDKSDQPGNIILKGNGETQRYIINMLGQIYPGKKYPLSKKDGNNIRLEYFKECLQQMEALEGSFAFPWRIGCGAAGGDWNLYLKALQDFEKKILGDVVIYRIDTPTDDRKVNTLF